MRPLWSRTSMNMDLPMSRCAVMRPATENLGSLRKFTFVESAARFVALAVGRELVLERVDALCAQLARACPGAFDERIFRWLLLIFHNESGDRTRWQARVQLRNHRLSMNGARRAGVKIRPASEVAPSQCARQSAGQGGQRSLSNIRRRRGTGFPWWWHRIRTPLFPGGDGVGQADTYSPLLREEVFPCAAQ